MFSFAFCDDSFNDIYIPSLISCISAVYCSYISFIHKNATPASEVDGEGSRVDLEASAAQMDADNATGNISQSGTPTPEDQQKQSSDTDGQEAGQIEADAEAEPEIVDGETDADVDMVATV